jgi:DNA-binding CsgD family transcriptional regulator
MPSQPQAMAHSIPLVSSFANILLYTNVYQNPCRDKVSGMEKNDIVRQAPMVGFVWRRIPVISQHKLGLEPLHPESFDSWSSDLLFRYEDRCHRYLSALTEQTALLESEGAEHIFVAPEAIGSVKLKVLDRLLRDLPQGTFILVTSWGNLGSQSIVEEIVTTASSQGWFFILPSHKSLRNMPPSDVPQVHKSWVIDSIGNSYVSSSSRRYQILALQEQGLSPEEIQLELGISKSTYYRQLDSNAPVIDKKKQVLELLQIGKSPVEIQASLGISSSTYYRLMGQLTFSDSTGSQVFPKPEK